MPTIRTPRIAPACAVLVLSAVLSACSSGDSSGPGDSLQAYLAMNDGSTSLTVDGEFGADGGLLRPSAVTITRAVVESWINQALAKVTTYRLNASQMSAWVDYFMTQAARGETSLRQEMDVMAVRDAKTYGWPAAPQETLVAQVVSGTLMSGPGVGIDALWTSPVGGARVQQQAYRFRATEAAGLRSVRIYLARQASYSGGTGGTLVAELRANNPTGNVPADAVLASATLNAPKSGSTSFPNLVFNKAVALQKGALYHIVLRNSASTAATNFVSVFSSGTRAPVRTPTRQPFAPDLDWAQLTRSGTGPWLAREGLSTNTTAVTPIMQIEYTSGNVAGQTYMEVGAEGVSAGSVLRGGPKAVTPSSQIAQTFIVPTGSGVAALNAFTVRVSRASTSGGGTLTATVEDVNGVAAGTASVASTTVDTVASWVTFKFAKPLALQAGQQYRVRLSSTGAAYQLIAIREGTSTNDPANAFDERLSAKGRAEFQEAGKWVGWDQWGVLNRDDWDLQYYLTYAVATAATPAPVATVTRTGIEAWITEELSKVTTYRLNATQMKSWADYLVTRASLGATAVRAEIAAMVQQDMAKYGWPSLAGPAPVPQLPASTVSITRTTIGDWINAEMAKITSYRLTTSQMAAWTDYLITRTANGAETLKAEIAAMVTQDATRYAWPALNGAPAPAPSPTPAPAPAPSGSTLNTLDTIVSDMRLMNDAGLKGVNPNFGFSRGPGYVIQGNEPRGTNAPDWWKGQYSWLVTDEYWNYAIPFMVVFEGNNNGASNLRVHVRNMKLFVKRKDSGRWDMISNENSMGGEVCDQSSNYYHCEGSPTFRSEPEGGVSVPYVWGKNFHGYYGGLRYINGANVAAVMVTMQARLIPNNTSAANDIGQAEFLMHVGADYYREQGRSSVLYPAVGLSRAKKITQSWQAFSMVTFSDVGKQEPGGGVSEANFRGDHPPLD